MGALIGVIASVVLTAGSQVHALQGNGPPVSPLWIDAAYNVSCGGSTTRVKFREAEQSLLLDIERIRQGKNAVRPGPIFRKVLTLDLYFKNIEGYCDQDHNTMIRFITTSPDRSVYELAIDVRISSG
ncbi:MAG: hypothetical protein K2Q06_16540, partial [Parvularculaceae bacterium]|nr:hypothetical protein [Parvularculaceae bacterium]